MSKPLGRKEKCDEVMGDMQSLVQEAWVTKSYDLSLRLSLLAYARIWTLFPGLGGLEKVRCAVIFSLLNKNCNQAASVKYSIVCT